MEQNIPFWIQATIVTAIVGILATALLRFWAWVHKEILELQQKQTATDGVVASMLTRCLDRSEVSKSVNESVKNLEHDTTRLLVLMEAVQASLAKLDAQGGARLERIEHIEKTQAQMLGLMNGRKKSE